MNLNILEIHKNIKNTNTGCVSDFLHDFSVVMSILLQEAAVNSWQTLEYENVYIHICIFAK